MGSARDGLLRHHTPPLLVGGHHVPGRHPLHKAEQLFTALGWVVDIRFKVKKKIVKPLVSLLLPSFLFLFYPFLFSLTLSSTRRAAQASR